MSSSPPSTNAEATTISWEHIPKMTESSHSASSSNSSTSTMWKRFRQNLPKYGIKLRRLVDNHKNENTTKQRQFDLQPQPLLEDCDLLIKKTDAQLCKLAEAGETIIETNASEAKMLDLARWFTAHHIK
ncbi:MAG: hypothetical protein M1836_006978 [Candelina mexicana]|nr:MAG: hypothetical protein M1836_006978 [Candelina mexicana]